MLEQLNVNVNLDRENHNKKVLKTKFWILFHVKLI